MPFSRTWRALNGLSNGAAESLSHGIIFRTFTNPPAGYNGHDVAMSNIMGHVLAERAMGKPAAEPDFPTTEIQPFPLHRFHRIGVRTVMSWMSIRDTLERTLGI